MYYELTDHFHVAADVGRTWEFFSTAENLSDITPPWLGFTNRSNGINAIGNNAILDYTIRWMGVPVKWRTKIIDWDPPRLFIDLQVRGPYELWHHQHTFTPTDGDGGGVVCFDRVIYKLPLGPIGRVTHAAIVKKQLMEIFRFRRRVIGQRLGWVRALQNEPIIRAL